MKNNITATVIADSVNENNVRITTFELEYPRYIHAEFLVHRQFSRNAASSRAIPVKKMLKTIKDNPAMPIHWGKNQKGMQAKTEHDALVYLSESESDAVTKEEAWKEAMHSAIEYATAFSNAGYHKQIVNRITEPYQIIKVVVTATEWDNWYELRDHGDAQPEIRELARKMRAAHDASEPRHLKPGEWHLPYVQGNEKVEHLIQDDIDAAIRISVSCCAQVSYRVLDDSAEKADKIFDRLVSSRPMHASPLEHVAMAPKDYATDCFTHMTFGDRQDFWSANFRDWVQYRQVYMKALNDSTGGQNG